MKRTLIAAALIAGALSAQAAFVCSDDIYGIINIPIEEGYNAIGVNLLPMPGAGSSIADVVIPDGLAAGTDLTTADNLSVWNGEGYTDYWYAGNGVWTPVDGSSPVPAATLGTAAWIKRKAGEGALTIYQVGQVVAAATNIAVNAGNTFIANPYPVATELNGGNLLWDGTCVATGKTRQNKADLIRMWNGTGYTTFWYCTHPTYPTNPAYTGWKHGNDIVNVTIPAGAGFWFHRRGTGDAPIPTSDPF
ncbi:MAG: hypothetical protein ACOX9C_00505 [Kiritimatiellia bacterium]|jgi:hypothetical protein